MHIACLGWMSTLIFYFSCQPSEEMSDWVVFLFNKRDHSYPSTSRSSRSLPPQANAMVNEAKSSSAWSEQRTTWNHALYFCRQVARDYKTLVDAQRAAM